MVRQCVAGRPVQNEEWQGLSSILFESVMAREYGPQYVQILDHDDIKNLGKSLNR